MRKLAITLAILGVFAASAAFAGTLLTEPFTYPNGNLVGNDGWVNYSGTGDIQIATNTATGQMGISASGSDDHTPFTLRTTSQATYACFDVMIPCSTLITPPMAAYFAGFNTTTNTTLMVARVYVLPITGGWTFGISNASTNSTAFGATPWGTTTLNCDQWYHIVIKYDPTVGTSTMWVDPVNEASTSVSNTQSSQAAVAVNTFFLRQGGVSALFPAFPGTGTWKWTVDNANVGGTYTDACGGPVAVAPSTWTAAKNLYR
jgi:hypothetical protein